MASIFEIKYTTDDQFFFVLKAPNGETILTSETHATKASAHYGIASVMTNALLDRRFERKISPRGDPFFVLVATNGDLLGTSDVYAAPPAMECGVESVKRHAPQARVDDLTTRS